jgi:hypothetical protein
MANRSEPNAQNSELDPNKHPSGARIEKIMTGESASAEKTDNDKGLYGETLRPSEREDSYIPTQDKAEGSREDVHRRSPSNRQH